MKEEEFVCILKEGGITNEDEQKKYWGLFLSYCKSRSGDKSFNEDSLIPLIKKATESAKVDNKGPFPRPLINF